MNLLEIFAISVALGTDLASVAIPIGMNRFRRRVILRAAACFALFHIVMLLAGYHTGHWLESVVEQAETYHETWPMAAAENWAGIAGALVLAAVGGHMIKGNISGGEQGSALGHSLQGLTLVALAASLSLDALAAGFSMGMMDVDLVILSVILGVVIFAIAVISLTLGQKLGRLIGKRAELAGGLVLILLGIHFFWTAVYL